MQKMSIINIHAPTEESSVDIKEEFFSRLDEDYEKILKSDIKLVIRDFNTKIGKENMIMSTIGEHSKNQNTDESCHFLTDFAKEK